MSKARLILIVLICASPIVLLWDGIVMQGVIAGCVALALAITANALRPGETAFLVSVVRPAAAMAALPALCMVVQVLPLRPLANPMWSSAEAALGHHLAAAVTIDRGASVIGLGQYISLCCIGFVSAAVAVERLRAESILFALTAAGALIAILVLGYDLFFPHGGFSSMTHVQATTCIALGGLSAAAACIRSLERYETRHSNPQRSTAAIVQTLAACACAFVICVLALLVDAPRAVLVASLCGLAVLASLMAIRRFGLGPWGTAGVAIPLIGVAALLIATQANVHDKNVLLTFATPAQESSLAISQRVLHDAPALGTGAGTFFAIGSVYREENDPQSGPAAATGAATMAIELGEPMLWVIVAATLSAIAILLRASLKRGRDSFYPALGASCLIALLLLAFVNPGLLGNAPGLLAGSILGLAIAQSKSRTVQLSGLA